MIVIGTMIRKPIGERMNTASSVAEIGSVAIDLFISVPRMFITSPRLSHRSLTSDRYQRRVAWRTAIVDAKS